MRSWKTGALLAVASLVLAAAGGCGDGEPPEGDDKPDEADDAEAHVYGQTVVFNGVEYTCLMVGYDGYQGLWCERKIDY